jgi:hypothetical protein
MANYVFWVCRKFALFVVCIVIRFGVFVKFFGFGCNKHQGMWMRYSLQVEKDATYADMCLML